MTNARKKCKVNDNNRDEDCVMSDGVTLLEHQRNEEILEEAREESIAMVMRRRRWNRSGT